LEASTTVSDFAVSSYIPNISTVLNKSRAPQAFDTNSGVFLVSQPNTPGQVPIPGTVRERIAIEEELDNKKIRYLSVEGEAATTGVGIENMGQYTCIHFACHASQDPEPLSSGFFLYNGRLDLSTIIRSNLKSADLAFLSACQTSTGDESLSDEAVHLAAGMLAAGYRGVIATMWSIKDRYAPVIARSFYRELLRLTRAHGVEGINGLCAAEALHHARQELRQELGDSEDALMTWIPYVHFGL
jgi:CHAT domain-containing protein